MSTLELNNVSKSFLKTESDEVTHALDQINLKIEKGEFISIVGTSGCGKSTILRMVAGLIPPTQGALIFDGEEIKGPSPKRGMVFQKPTLFPWLTVEKNISFSLRMQGKYRGNEKKVEELLNMVGMQDFRKDYPHQLSGGMAQRVALIRTLINEPEILLLDEPLGALDAFTRMNMQDEILNMWKKQGNTVLMVTHDVDEAIYMGTRVLVMEPRPGKIKEDIRINLDYPRNRSSHKFTEYRNYILEMLDFGQNEA
ncbi:ABC transporter ATP-binding protein [Eubacterium ramulus]